MKKEKLKIIYEDKDIIVVYKKSGLLTISTSIEKEKTLYHEVLLYLKSKNNKVFIVHRLDKDTSGLVIFAKNIQTKKYLQNNWQDFQKFYITAVHGKLNKSKGIIQSYLKESSTYQVYSTKSKNGKLAITEYEVINEKDNLSLLKITLKTGRKNQIRVHMHDINHPVLGDKKYGIKDNYKVLYLQCYYLKIIHPKSKKEMAFELPFDYIFNDLFK